MSTFRSLLEDLAFLLDEQRAAPEGTRTFRKDGEYQKVNGKWQKIKRSTSSGWKGKFALGPKNVSISRYAWSSAFDDREHQKAIEQHRTAEKAHRDEVAKIDQRLNKLKERAKTAGPEQREKLVAKHNELAAKRELHRAVAREARTAGQEIAKDLETAKSDRTWQRKAKAALAKSAEREGINIIGRSKVRGSDEDEPAGSSTPIPNYVSKPDHYFTIGAQAIAGEPEPIATTAKNLWRPGMDSISHVAEPKPKEQFGSDYYAKLNAKTTKLPDYSGSAERAVRTIELGRGHYGDFKSQKNQKLRAALPKAANAISLPIMFQTA